MSGPKLPGHTDNVVQFRPPARTGMSETAGRTALRRVVCAAGLTTPQAAEVAGVSERTMRRWLTGEQDPGLTPFLRLAELAEQKRAA